MPNAFGWSLLQVFSQILDASTSQQRSTAWDMKYPPRPCPIIAEVKGRKFKGTSTKGLKGFECWVTLDDVKGLINWELIFGSEMEVYFIFAWQFENVDIEADGNEIYEFAQNQYMFYALKLDDYRAFMKIRSPKWQTVTLPAAKFREFATPARELLLPSQNEFLEVL